MFNSHTCDSALRSFVISKPTRMGFEIRVCHILVWMSHALNDTNSPNRTHKLPTCQWACGLGPAQDTGS